MALYPHDAIIVERSIRMGVAGKNEHPLQESEPIAAPPEPKSSPLVSVVIPAHNAEQYLAETLQSVFAQTYTALEVIVVDDGSTDGTAALVREQFPAAACLSKVNGRVARARNHGIDHARGEWIAFLDADDVWLPEKIARQMAAVRDRPEVGLCFTDCTVFLNEPRKVLHRASTAITPKPGGGAAALFEDNFITTSTVMVRRSVLDAVGQFSPEFHGPEDFDLWLRIAERFSIAYIDEPLALYRRHTESLTALIRTQNYIDQHRKICARALSRRPDIYRPLIGRAHARFAVNVAYRMMNRSDGKEARRLLRLAIYEAPQWLRPYLLYFATFMPDAMVRLGREMRQRVRQSRVAVRGP